LLNLKLSNISVETALSSLGEDKKSLTSLYFAKIMGKEYSVELKNFRLKSEGLEIIQPLLSFEGTGDSLEKNKKTIIIIRNSSFLL
jgi:hypothetical protein